MREHHEKAHAAEVDVGPAECFALELQTFFELRASVGERARCVIDVLTFLGSFACSATSVPFHRDSISSSVLALLGELASPCIEIAT